MADKLMDDLPKDLYETIKPQDPKDTVFATKEFQALRKEWYAKLKDDGFNDIEWSDHSWFIERGQLGERIKIRAATLVQSQDFYRYGAQYLYMRKWPLKRDRYIWERYMEGASGPDIVKELRASQYKKWHVSRSVVYRVIHEITNEVQNLVKEGGFDA